MKEFFVLIFVVKWIAVLSNPVSLPGCKSNVGNCEDSNELCEFIPLPHILCNREKIKQECPRLCNNCPAITTLPSIKSTESNSEKNAGDETEMSTENYIENTTVTESGKYHLLSCYSFKQP